MKALLLAAAAAVLGGCAVYPADPYYGYGDAAVVAPAPVYVAPSVYVGPRYYHRGYRGHGGHRGHGGGGHRGHHGRHR